MRDLKRMTTLLAVTALLALCYLTRQANAHPTTCRNALAALTFYRSSYQHWVTLYHYGRPTRLDPINLTCRHARTASIIWRAKAQQMHGIYASEFHWRNWLPGKWQRIGRCETGLNWQHHNSRYTSAFGIGSEYDRDAAYEPSSHDTGFGFVKVPVRGWSQHPWPPSPWEQFQAALGHYLRFGLSGWGCRNA